MTSQPDYQTQPKFRLGEMVIYGDSIVRVIGREQFLPGNLWFYLLGAKVGKKKMQWFSRVYEADLVKPCWTNVVELGRTS